MDQNPGSRVNLMHPTFIIRPVGRTGHGKMKQILRRDWLPAWSRWSYLARSGLPVTRAPLFTGKTGDMINPLLAKFVRSRWRDVGLVFFLSFLLQ